MNIDWLIPCRYAEVHENLATIVGAGIDTFTVPELPAPIDVMVAVRLLATGDELGPGHDHTVRSIVRDPGGAELSNVEEVFEVGTFEEADRARTEWLNGVELLTVVRFQATEAGTYTYEHIVDDSSQSVPLHVVVEELPDGELGEP